MEKFKKGDCLIHLDFPTESYIVLGLGKVYDDKRKTYWYDSYKLQMKDGKTTLISKIISVETSLRLATPAERILYGNIGSTNGKV